MTTPTRQGGAPAAERPRTPGLANLDWAYAALDALVRAGVRHVVASPGSRSTPLVLAANRHAGLTLTVVLDERAAAFHALGLAKGAEAPVALIATSGTAAANYHPALAEAAGSGVPLIALTADRPPRLRGLGAPQTIDQVRLYGPTAAFVELPVAGADPALRRAMALRVAGAVATALGPPAAPLHMNVPFDEPLAPSRDELAAWAPPAGSAPWIAPPRPLADAGALAAIATRLAAACRPVLVAGPEAGARGAAAALRAWAAAAGMPVVADVGSGLRATGAADPEGPRPMQGDGAADGALVAAHADLYLRGARAQALTPDLIVLAGGAPTSKAVSQWLAAAHAAGAGAVALWPDARTRDPEALADLVAVGDVADAAARLTAGAGGAREPRWLDAWRAAEAKATRAIGAGAVPIPAEAAAVRAAAAALPPGGLLALSNSLPIRHADAYLGAAPDGPRPIVFRGANGIDGVTAAALGAARGAGRPLLLVTGDLAFLHDLGGLATARALTEAGGTAVILVLDNDGGAIFHHLPIADAAPDFEALFATPQGRDLPRAAALFDLPCADAPDVAAVGAAVAAGLARGGASVVVFRSEREATVNDHRAFVAEVAR